jgi:potassium-transporting ATPase KdpC subunit
MKKHIVTAALYTPITALLLGIVYPFTVMLISQQTMRAKANGQLIVRNGEVAGSYLIGQPFTGPEYFHSRPSAAGTGYDATASSGSNLAQTNKALLDRLNASIAAEKTGAPVPIDLITASGSGLDPDITPATGYYQVSRIAQARHLPEEAVRQLVTNAIIPRQFGLLGEPRVNVLDLNLRLDQLKSGKPESW